MTDEPDGHTFRSIRHPGPRTKAVVAATALVRPLGFCMLPVMIGALVTMLQGYWALPWLTVGFPIASACALAWTWIRIRHDVCEITISDGRVSARSVFEAAEPVSPANWKWLIDLHDHGDYARATIGLSSIRLDRDEWPRWHAMIPALDYADTSSLPETTDE